MKKKLTLKKLTVASLDENLMRSIRGGDGGEAADTYGGDCTVYCETKGPACTKVPCDNSNECPSFDTECEGGPSEGVPQNCHTGGLCTVTHCTDECPHSYNDPTCPTVPITSLGIPCTV